MSSGPVIHVEHLSKEYRLGTINHGTLHRDLQSWWARMRGKPDPNALIREDERLRGSADEGGAGIEAEEDHDLGPRRERFLALDDVSFDVEEGETFGIIGKNGAGKSTLLKILCRITAPTAGGAHIRGRIASLLEVGTGFHPELTGRENVYLNGAILGMTRAEIRRKFDDIVEFSQLERFIDTPVKRYSSGMYVRLAFSVAAHLDAEVLIVDEVLAVGDYEFQKKCLEKLRDVTAKGRTVLLVSHNLSAVQNLCTRSILLRRGRLVASGETSRVVESYIAKPKASAEAVPLALRQDRTGSGLFRFIDARLDVDDPAGGPIASGCDAVIRIWLDNRQGDLLCDVDVAIGVDNYVGDRIMVFTTNAVAATLAEVHPGRELVEFRIPKLPLVAGRYYFTLFGTVGGVIADWVQSAASFDVAHGDFFGTGRTLPAGQGSILAYYSVRTGGARVSQFEGLPRR
jgi:lipopolysaccharide transport system ATP-binding protein